jgi:hypothetical protein
VAHTTYPEAKIYGSENWVTWPEWKAVNEREFVAGIFVWTGFAYMGEAGPWPRKGLNISLFDFAGYKSPRGHLFETLWREDPKVYMATIPEDESEFSFTEEHGWIFTERTYEIPAMSWLRRWEWYDLHEKWNYNESESIVVQAYTNCEEAELFLNGETLGRKSLSDFEDRILKWLVPFQSGELEIRGHKNGNIADRYTLRTAGEASDIDIRATREEMEANYRDVVLVETQLVDASGTPVRDRDREIRFSVEGNVRVLGIDNGSEYNVEDAKSESITTYRGRAFLFLQATGKPGEVKISASTADLRSEEVTIQISK